MAYATANLHDAVSAGYASRIWIYDGTDAAATVIAAGYISDSYDRGMKVGDLVIVRQFSTSAFTALTALTIHSCSASVSGTGATLSATLSGGTAILSNSAASAPLVTSDSAAGYALGSTWYNTATLEAWYCADATATAAVWVPIGPTQVTLCNNGLSSKASDAAVARFIAPFKFRIVRVDTVLNGALATGDATFTTAIAGTGVTDGVVTATESGSAAGDIDTATPSALNTGAAGALITVTGGGASTATATADIQVTLVQTA